MAYEMVIEHLREARLKREKKRRVMLEHKNDLVAEYLTLVAEIQEIDDAIIALESAVAVGGPAAPGTD